VLGRRRGGARGPRKRPTAAKEKVLSALPSAVPMMMTVVAGNGGGGGGGGGSKKVERERERRRGAGEAKGGSCPAWTCALLHGRPGDSLSAR